MRWRCILLNRHWLVRRTRANLWAYRPEDLITLDRQRDLDLWVISRIVHGTMQCQELAFSACTVSYTLCFDSRLVNLNAFLSWPYVYSLISRLNWVTRPVLVSSVALHLVFSSPTTSHLVCEMRTAANDLRSQRKGPESTSFVRSRIKQSKLHLGHDILRNISHRIPWLH